MADWSQLHEDILELIFNLCSMSNIVRCGAVCKSWHPFWRDWSGSLGRQFPWLMMLPEDNPTGSDRRDFLSCFTKSNIDTIHLPGIGGKRCCGSSNNGWLVTVDENQNVQLFHPWRRILFHLPNQSTFLWQPFVDEGYSPKELRDMQIVKAFLSPDESTVVVIYGINSLGFCRVGDERWTDFVRRPPPSMGCLEEIVFEGGEQLLNGSSVRITTIEDVVYHKGKIYALDCFGCIWLCHIDTPIPNLEPLTHAEFKNCPMIISYLVVDPWTDQMFVVRRRHADIMDDDIDVQINTPHKTFEFFIFEVYLESNTFLRVKSLGDRIMFVGHNSSTLVKASDFPECKPNCIYFTDDYLGGYFVRKQFGCQDLGIFDMEERTVQPLPLNRFHPTLSPPIWVRPPLARDPQVKPLDKNLESKRL